jgi:hypothetical protein
VASERLELAGKVVGGHNVGEVRSREGSANPDMLLSSALYVFRPGPEDAVVCGVVEGLIEGQDAFAHVVDIFPSPAM